MGRVGVFGEVTSIRSLVHTILAQISFYVNKTDLAQKYYYL